MNGNNGLNAWIAYKLFVPLHSNVGFSHLQQVILK